MGGGARLSECERYRYDLWRDWHTPMELEARTYSGILSVEFVLWIMLNPSTAAGRDPMGKLINDPTMRKCVGFTQRMGFRRMFLGNLYGLRSKDPEDLISAVDPVGPDNDRWLKHYTEHAAVIVVGWGGFTPKFLAPRVARVREIIGSRPVVCLGANGDGSPKHPLFVGYEQRPVPWPVVVGG
jgi:hypothetical protein